MSYSPNHKLVNKIHPFLNHLSIVTSCCLVVLVLSSCLKTNQTSVQPQPNDTLSDASYSSNLDTANNNDVNQWLIPLISEYLIEDIQPLICGENTLEVGSQTLSTQADVDALSEVNKINGSLILNSVTELDFSPLIQLTEITGDFQLLHTANQVALNGFNCLSIIGDNFLIFDSFNNSNTTLDSISAFSTLSSVGGDFQIRANDVLTSVSDFPSLQSVNEDIRISANTLLTSLPAFPSLNNVDRGMHISGNSQLTTIPEFPALNLVGGTLNISVNNELTTISGFPVLTSVASDLKIVNDDKLTTIPNFPVLSSIGGDLEISVNDELRHISSFSTLNSIQGRLLIEDNPKLISISSFDNLESVTQLFNIFNNTELRTITEFDSLEVTGGFSITLHPNLNFIEDFPELRTVGTYFAIDRNNALTILPQFGSLKTVVGNFSIFSNANLETIPPPAFDLLTIITNGKLSIKNNTLLETLAIFPSLGSVGTEFNIEGNTKLGEIQGFPSLKIIGTDLEIINNVSMDSISGFNLLTNNGIQGVSRVNDNTAFKCTNSLLTFSPVDFSSGNLVDCP